LQNRFIFVIINIRILVFIVLMTLLQVKKLNIVNKKLTLSNFYSADGAIRLLESMVSYDVVRSEKANLLMAFFC